MTPAKLYKTFAVAEAFTWTFLIAGLITRAVVGIPSEIMFGVGALHGAVFLGYGVSAALVGVNQRWSFGRILLAIFLAIVPYATVPFERSVEKKNLLVGPWRKTETDDARDKNWFDRLFRWFINRPVLLVLVLILVVVAIFATLLHVGPPDTWGK